MTPFKSPEMTFIGFSFSLIDNLDTFNVSSVDNFDLNHCLSEHVACKVKSTEASMKFVFAFIISFSLNTGYALTLDEEIQFRSRVEDMSRLKKGVSAGLVTTGLVASCPVGGALSALSAVVDSVPLFGFFFQTVPMMYADVEFDDGSSVIDPYDSNFAYFITGGLGAAVVDLFTGSLDGTDLTLDEPFFEEMRDAYSETAYVVENAFGESGYCIDQWEKLGILLGLK